MLAFFFLMWTIFTVFIEFVIMLLLSHVLALWVQGMSDSRSLTRDQTSTLCIGRESLNHWTAREVPNSSRFRQGNHANVVLYCSQDPPFPPRPQQVDGRAGRAGASQCVLLTYEDSGFQAGLADSGYRTK